LLSLITVSCRDLDICSISATCWINPARQPDNSWLYRHETVNQI